MRAIQTLKGVVLTCLMALPIPAAAAAQLTSSPNCATYRAGYQADIDAVLATARSVPSEPAKLVLDKEVTDWFSPKPPENSYTLLGVLCKAESLEAAHRRQVEAVADVPIQLGLLVEGTNEVDRVERSLSTGIDGSFRIPDVVSGGYKFETDWGQVADAEVLVWIVRHIRRCSPDTLMPGEAPLELRTTGP